MTFRTTELQAGLLLQQVVHCCQWSTIRSGCLQWLFGGACCLGLFWRLIYVAVLSFYTGMFSVMLGFSSFTAFFLVIFECLEVFLLSAPAMHSKLTVLCLPTIIVAHPNCSGCCITYVHYICGNAGFCTVSTCAVSLSLQLPHYIQLPDYPMEGQVLYCA